MLITLLLALAGCQGSSADDVDPEARLNELNLKLPKPPAPVANYVAAVRTGDLLFLAGAGPQEEDGTYLSGRLGENFHIEQGYEAARLTALFQLPTLKAELGISTG